MNRPLSGERVSVSIAVQPWFKDHAFGGRIILPAVETMALLADWTAQVYPEADVRVMEAVRFVKFLEIPPDAASVDAVIEACPSSDGARVQVRLLSRVRCGTMTRLKEHGEVFFPLTCTDLLAAGVVPPVPVLPRTAGKRIRAERLYCDLIPFGPQCHTLQGSLKLVKNRAWGQVKAPLLPPAHAVERRIGSPFPLDGALHAACVLGQESSDFIPFPVAVQQRIILRPAQPGALYRINVLQTAQTQDQLFFDLHLFDRAGQNYEIARGVRMQDVSRGMKGLFNSKKMHVGRLRSK